MDPRNLELRRRLTAYLGGAASLEEFYNWFMPNAWNIAGGADTETTDLYHEVDLLLAEQSHGDWNEKELRERLASLTTSYYVVVSFDSGFVLDTVPFKTTVAGHSPDQRQLVDTPA